MAWLVLQCALMIAYSHLDLQDQTRLLLEILHETCRAPLRNVALTKLQEMGVEISQDIVSSGT